MKVVNKEKCSDVIIKNSYKTRTGVTLLLSLDSGVRTGQKHAS